jgi:hypothetical protein
MSGYRLGVTGVLLLMAHLEGRPVWNMNTKAKANRLGYLLYCVAAVLVLAGVVLNVSGHGRSGTALIIVGAGFALDAALRLGHVKRW